jgi:hypothetical protein
MGESTEFGSNLMIRDRLNPCMDMEGDGGDNLCGSTYRLRAACDFQILGLESGGGSLCSSTYRLLDWVLEQQLLARLAPNWLQPVTVLSNLYKSTR